MRRAFFTLHHEMARFIALVLIAFDFSFEILFYTLFAKRITFVLLLILFWR